jgi:hypothetical protein
LDGEDFILHVQGVFTRIRSGATLEALRRRRALDVDLLRRRRALDVDLPLIESK